MSKGLRVKRRSNTIKALTTKQESLSPITTSHHGLSQVNTETEKDGPGLGAQCFIPLWTRLSSYEKEQSVALAVRACPLTSKACLWHTDPCCTQPLESSKPDRQAFQLELPKSEPGWVWQSSTDSIKLFGGFRVCLPFLLLTNPAAVGHDSVLCLHLSSFASQMLACPPGLMGAWALKPLWPLLQSDHCRLLCYCASFWLILTPIINCFFYF